MNFTKLALKRPVSCVLIVLALAVFGISTLFTFKLELQPSMEMPMLLVITTYPGADPQSVEELVTKEIESAGSILSGVESYTSQSSENFSMVMFSYDYDMDIDDAYLDLRAALDSTIAKLPEDANKPYIMELNMDAQDTVTISATAVGDTDLLSYVNENVVPELETLLGVADVNVYGGQEEYIRIMLKEDKLSQYGITMSNVAQFISAVDFNIPAGTVKQGKQDLSVSSSAKTKTMSELKAVPITTSKGSVVTLGDIAEVVTSKKAATSISRYDGNENISIGVQKKQSQGTVNVANEVKKEVAKLQAQNSAVELEVVYDASTMIVSSLSSVGKTLVLGIALSMLVLFLFFGDFKASLIVGSSMPISLFATMIMMNAMNFSLNLVTTGALVIAIGMMVDNSIVVLESCFRLREKKADYKEAALEGTKVVTASIVASTLTTIVVYFPLSVMKGLSGQMFSQLGFTIIFAMVASLLSALTLIPLFFYQFKPKEKENLPINKGLHYIGEKYRVLLTKILYWKKTSVLVAVLLLFLSFVFVAFTNMELIPNVDERTIVINATFRSGTRLEVMNEDVLFLEDKVATDEKVNSYQIRISDNQASVTAYLKKDKSFTTAQVIEQWNEDLKYVTDMDLSITSSGANMTSQLSGGAEVDLIGRNLSDLKAASKQVEEVMRQTKGVLKVTSDINVASTKAEVRVDPLKATSVGLTPIQIAMNINYLLNGMEATTIKSEGKEYSVMLTYPDGVYQDMNQLMNLTLSTPYGSYVALRDIATVEYTDAPEVLTRVDGQYQIAIKATTTESAKFSAMKEINKKVNELTFPNGVSRSENMMEEMMNEEFSAIIRAIFISIFLVFLVMAMQFESPRFSGMVMMSIPFSMIGSFSLLFLTGSTLSMVSLMGLLMLIGIVVNNGILYVDTANMLHREMAVEEALIQSGQLRLRPILMTTLTTILSMLPLALGIGEGAVLMQGMALIIIGGLLASTVLILVLLPSFYLIIYEGKQNRKEKRKRKKLLISQNEG